MSAELVLSYLTKWYVVVCLLGTSYIVFQYIQQQLFIKRHGCKETTWNPDGKWFGIPFLRETLKLKTDGTLIDNAVEVFDQLGVRTFFLRLFGFRVLITIEPENIKALLATQFNDFALGFRHVQLKPLLGDGIFTLDGEGWKHSRAILRPQFAREQVAHVKALEPHLQILAKHIRAAKGETIDLQDLFFMLTVDTATEFLFGDSVHSLYDGIGLTPPNDIDGRADFAAAFNLSQKYLASRAYIQQFYWLINNKEFRDCNAKVHKVAKYYVNRALSFTPDDLEKKSGDGYVFLYELAKQTRNPTVLQDQLLNILVAGRDTTAGLLSFTFYELARNQHIFEKLKKEVYKAFGDGENARVEEITFESLKKCEYLKFVINEALRLYPSVPMNFRVATKNTTLPVGGGKDGLSPIFVGKGTTVAYSIFTTHRLKEFYGEDSSEFRPERWADLNKLGWAYLPFNGGPRICLGQQFALTEASYVIVRLLQMFPSLISKDDRPYPPRKSVHLTMCHQDGVFVEMS